MPRQAKGARLWLRKSRERGGGAGTRNAEWVIRDGSKQLGTGCREDNRAAAESGLAAYIAAKYTPIRRERDIAAIPVADVISIYLTDVVPGQARPKQAGERAGRLLEFFGAMMLADITGRSCRDYAAARGHAGGARRDLEDLRAAINHHEKEGLHRARIRVVLPPKGEARQLYLTRDQFARLLRVCWRQREMQEGKATAKFPMRHLCRFLILALYTGSRPGAVLTAAWDRAPGKSWVDLSRGRFHRLAEGKIATDKRQPPVTLAPRLQAHLRRWSKADAGQGHVVRFAGQPVASIKTAMGRACRLAGLPQGVSAYTLRHTAATWLLSKGVSIFDTANFLGTSPAMIEKNYGHVMPEYLQNAARAIGRK